MITIHYDSRATFQLLGCLLVKPDLLVSGDYEFELDDFPVRFHKLIYNAIYKLYSENNKSISILEVDNYLSKFKEQYQVFQDNRGIEWLEKAKELANLDNYAKECETVKKFSLLREAEKINLNVSEVYDENDEAKIKRFHNMGIDDLINYFQMKILSLEQKFLSANDGIHAGDELEEQVEGYKTTPEMGIDMGIDAFNNITFGMRKKYYLFSGASGYGKTRFLAYLAIQAGVKQKKPTLFITTELDNREIQAMLLAGVSGVPERNILTNRYAKGEEKRVKEAIDILKESKLYIVYCPDFTVEKIEMLIKKYILLYGVEYIIFDYIKDSMSIIQSINKKTGGSLAVHQILYLLSERLKTLSGMYNVGIYSATQLSASNFFSKDNKGNVNQSNQSMLAGAKAIANACDVGGIIRPATKEEIEKHGLETYRFGKNSKHYQLLFIDLYKNRRGLKDVSIGLCANLGTLSYEETVVLKEGEEMHYEKVILI